MFNQKNKKTSKICNCPPGYKCSRCSHCYRCHHTVFKRKGEIVAWICADGVVRPIIQEKA